MKIKAIVTGGAGFIGSHAVRKFLSLGMEVVAVDNLSRPGASANLEWLRSGAGGLRFVHADVRDRDGIDSIFEANPGAGLILHAAGQVAVTTSVLNPRLDFETNALGTLNVLEAARRYSAGAAFIFTSTNKVYGALDSHGVREINRRYAFTEAADGIGEGEPLDFHSPYGCSKGCADQYVRDYARIYGLKTVVLRQSCIYGTRQFGIEDQGWVAWFAIGATLGKPITIYGDGKQVRDVLWVDDLVDLYVRVFEEIDVAAGQAYNVGGGPENTLSLLELVAMLGDKLGREMRPAAADWRPGDQRIFVSDIRKVARELDWRPTVTPPQGVARLVDWARQSEELLRNVLG